MKSYLFKGFVEHTRFKPRYHTFHYPIYVYGFHLQELPILNHALPFFGYNRFRPVSIYDADYLDHKQGSIQHKLMRYLEAKGCAQDITNIILITSARYFNYIFNPVSFYYCFSKDNRLRCMVAEVNNTFGERHLYILDQPESPVPGFIGHYKAKKAFHVSPFHDMQGTYEFLFSGLENELDIRINLLRDNEPVFKAKLCGKKLALNPRNHFKVLVANPLVPHLTKTRIFWQATQLHFIKKLPVNPKPVARSTMTIRRKPPALFQKLAMKGVFNLFQDITSGCLNFVMPEGHMVRFGTPSSVLQAQIDVNDYRLFSRVILGGDTGLGEAFMFDEWDSQNVTTVIKLLIKNRETLSHGNFYTAWLSRIFNYCRWLTQKNNITGSRRNIGQHYDLGNEFFQLFLDPSMTYSCGIFRSPQDSLESAQKTKMHSIIEKSRINSQDHVLEIGCGWGALAIETVKQTGCRYTGITISKAQYDLASQRVKTAGLEDLITIRLNDYRDINGKFDKIISIEMLEAVGHDYFSEFFKSCERLLKPDGLVVLQVITIPDYYYDRYRRECDWIQKHIFPGGLLPSLKVLCENMSRYSRLIVEDIENIGINYALTLSRWRNNFIRNIDHIQDMGFDRTFQRKWIYYFSCCEAAFATRNLSTLQMVLTRTDNKHLNDAISFEP